MGQEQGAEYAPTDNEAEAAGEQDAQEVQDDLDEAGVPANDAPDAPTAGSSD